MIGLGAGLDQRLLDLDEITDVNVVLQARARAQPRIGADQRPFAHVGAVEMREGADHGVVFNRDAGSEHHERLHHDLATELGIRRQKHRLGRDQGHARIHCRVA